MGDVKAAEIAAKPALEARTVSISYGDRLLLDNLDLAVASTEFLAVLALGGAGKSLLFRTLIGLQKPTTGQVFWFGNDISKLTERQKQTLRRSIGAVHQQGALFADLTVEENVMLPLVELSDHDSQQIRSTVRFTLDVAGLSDHANSHPTSLAAVTIRKVALARALVLGPRLLVCDDVFAGLDPMAQRQITDYIRALHMLRSMATVILTHNVNVALELADRVAVLAEGHIVATGTPSQILQSALPGVRALLDVRASPD
jgi:phospholipid/cholesterol/gamma-HCH transport system ATP-binding protein